MSASTLLKTIGVGIKTHKPEIMIGVGVATSIGAIIVAVKETPACLEAFDQAEAEAPVIKETDELGQEIEINLGLDFKTKMLILGKCYWKVILMEAVAITFIVYGSKIRLDSYAVLAALYSATKADLDDLKQIISEQPENWKKKFQEKVAESHIEHSDPKDIPEPRMSNTEMPMPLPLLWDDQAKVFFRMSEEDLRDAIAEFTHMISTDPFQSTTMNDWMRIINHEDVVDGDYKIMSMSDPNWDGPLKYNQIGVKEAPNGEPARSMRFSIDYSLDTRGLYSNV